MIRDKNGIVSWNSTEMQAGPSSAQLTFTSVTYIAPLCIEITPHLTLKALLLKLQRFTAL